MKGQSPSAESGWRQSNPTPSLAEVNRSITVPKVLSFWRKMGEFVNPPKIKALA